MILLSRLILLVLLLLPVAGSAALLLASLALSTGVPVAAFALAGAGLLVGLAGAGFVGLRIMAALRVLSREAEAIRRLDLTDPVPPQGGPRLCGRTK